MPKGRKKWQISQQETCAVNCVLNCNVLSSLIYFGASSTHKHFLFRFIIVLIGQTVGVVNKNELTRVRLQCLFIDS